MSERSLRFALPPWLTYERMAYVFCLVAALSFFFQADDLEMWTIVGPGPGLFPTIATGACIALAAALTLFPRLGDDRIVAVVPADQPESEPPMDATERRVFWVYCLVLPLLVVGSIYLGFIALCVALTLTLTWWAERGSFAGALIFGLGCGIVGVVGFNYYLSTSIPLSELDQILLRLFH